MAGDNGANHTCWLLTHPELSTEAAARVAARVRLVVFVRSASMMSNYEGGHQCPCPHSGRKTIQTYFQTQSPGLFRTSSMDQHRTRQIKFIQAYFVPLVKGSGTRIEQKWAMFPMYSATIMSPSVNRVKLKLTYSDSVLYTCNYFTRSVTCFRPDAPEFTL